MRNNFSVVCVLFVVAVGLTVAQTPAQKPPVDQAKVEALKKQLEQKEAEIKSEMADRDRYEDYLKAEPPPPPKTELEEAQDLFVILFQCAGGPAECFIHLARQEKDDDNSNDDKQDKRRAAFMNLLEDSQKKLEQLTLESDAIRSELHAAGVDLARGSILGFTVESPNDEQKRLEAEAKDKLGKKLEEKNRKKDDPPPPPAPPPISSIAGPPARDLASTFVVMPANATTTNAGFHFDLGGALFVATNDLNVFQLAIATAAKPLLTTQRQAATAEKAVIEVPASTQPAARGNDLFEARSLTPEARSLKWTGRGSAPWLPSVFSFAGARRPDAFQSPRPAGTDASSSIKMILTSLGRSTGEAVQMTVINQGEKPVTIAGDGFVLEPIAQVTEQKVKDELKRFDRAGKATVTLNAYCLDLLKDPPAVGTVFRLADRAAQQEFGALRPILAASRALRTAGRLPPDAGDEKAYVDAIRQWAIWTQREKFDERRFTDAFVDHARKNMAAAGRRWTDDLGKALRQLTPGRWRAIQLVLQEAARGN